MAGPHYRVRLHITDSGNSCWHTSVPVKAKETLPHTEIEKQARVNAVKAFGPQASDWTMIDAERRI